MSEENIPVTVHILEKEYRIACAPNHKESLEDSAALLNDKMLEIAERINRGIFSRTRQKMTLKVGICCL